MNSQIKAEVERRGIKRLCHFTPSRNLGQILSGNVGILATKNLKENERIAYTPTDLQRLDGCADYISCSIEYPNTWYFDRARARETLFRDWVVLFIDPKYIWHDGTRFCPRNAAALFGRDVASGAEAFERLFSDRTVGARGRSYVRSSRTLDCCPTDEQAEALVPDCILISDILGVAVRDEGQATDELVRFDLLGISRARRESIRFYVAPDLFEKQRLSSLLKSGQRPDESLFTVKLPC
jgi:ssDNA thymidine ADP-ribosyltransferase, DarT